MVSGEINKIFQTFFFLMGLGRKFSEVHVDFALMLNFSDTAVVTSNG